MSGPPVMLDLAVLVLALGALVQDLWLPVSAKRRLGYWLALGLVVVLGYSLVRMEAEPARFAFGQSYVLDGLALYFKRFFLLSGALVLVWATAFADGLETGWGEFYSLHLLALVGMLVAASAHDFVTLLVAVELITTSFYVLTSFERRRLGSLEAGSKYWVLGAMASGVMVYGIALVYGAAGTLQFGQLAQKAATLQGNGLFRIGLLLVLLALAFKIAAVPMQLWVPDVYQGAPTPVTAWLAVGSKAAGAVLLLRLFWTALPPSVAVPWTRLLMVLAAASILYGSLCAIPQRNLKRLLGYSSIAHAGYLLLGIAAFSPSGTAAVLYFLGGYLFTVLAAFGVLVLVMRASQAEDIDSLAGLSRRAPALAAVLALAMVSLAGVPPLAGFFGKFLLIKALLEAGPAFYWLVGVALFGVVVSLWYYFGVIRAAYWAPAAEALPRIRVPAVSWAGLGVCVAGMWFLGLFPSALVDLASRVAQSLQ